MHQSNKTSIWNTVDKEIYTLVARYALWNARRKVYDLRVGLSWDGLYHIKDQIREVTPTTNSWMLKMQHMQRISRNDI